METILALADGGQRLMPLVAADAKPSEEAAELLRKQTGTGLFPKAAHPDAAVSGLWLLFSYFDQAHSIAQDILSTEGSYWHAMVHRQEPDAGNSGYWFRRVGVHPVFGELNDAAQELAGAAPRGGLALGPKWDPFAFIDFCEIARQKAGSAEEKLAREIQQVEWQLLFDYCARPKA